jgi:hypothetical protein
MVDLSSYRYYCGKQKAPGWMATGSILAELGQRTRGAQEAMYRRELEEAAGVGQMGAGLEDGP